MKIPAPPSGYRLLKAGEYTQGGDLGLMGLGRHDEKLEWREMWSGHVVNQRVLKPGRVARKETTNEPTQ